MVNLLPDELREHAAVEYRFRLTALIALGVGSLTLLATALLLPAYFFAWVARNNAHVQQALITQSFNQKELLEAAQVGRETVVLLSSISKEFEAGRPSSVIRKLTDARPSGISIRNINYQRNDSSTHITFLGTARTRETLLSFKAEISKVPGIVEVDLPVSNLTKSSDLPFTLNVIYTPPRL